MLREHNSGMITLSEAESLLAKRAGKALSRVVAADLPPYLHFAELPPDIVIPKAVLPLISQMLDAISRGESIRLMAESRELTPQQAARVLGVSRPLLMHIVKQNIIPHRRVGSHYRLPLQAVLDYQGEKQRRQGLLNQLTAEAQELDSDY